MLIVTAPYIDFRLHRTRSVYVEVQNRYLEQVVVGTGNLSAPGFQNSSRQERNLHALVTPLMRAGNSAEVESQPIVLHNSGRWKSRRLGLFGEGLHRRWHRARYDSFAMASGLKSRSP
jgi:hypothetical protein